MNFIGDYFALGDFAAIDVAFANWKLPARR